jgi:lipoprotein-anchoring transpeptidase ErfK/SrfK
MRFRLLSLCLLTIGCFWVFRPVLAADDGSSLAVLISVPDQKLALMQGGACVAQYPVSTSRYGVGDRFGSYATPVGWMEVAQKIGQGWPLGTVFKERRPTGEVLRPNAPGRDPIVTRILWLRGLESSSRNAYERGIYIHGTPVERQIGRPASYGCIRMRSRDVADLFGRIGIGTRVQITTQRLPQALVAVAEARPGA